MDDTDASHSDQADQPSQQWLSFGDGDVLENDVGVNQVEPVRRQTFQLAGRQEAYLRRSPFGAVLGRLLQHAWRNVDACHRRSAPRKGNEKPAYPTAIVQYALRLEDPCSKLAFNRGVEITDMMFSALEELFQGLFRQIYIQKLWMGKHPKEGILFSPFPPVPLRIVRHDSDGKARLDPGLRLDLRP